MGRIIAALAAIAAIAGCAGSHGQFSPVSPVTSGSNFLQNGNQELFGGEPDLCRHVGIIRLSPCHVHFTSSESKPVLVAVTIQGHLNGTVVQHNDCGGLSGVAKISRRTNFRWKVAAGSSTGSCLARFIFYHNGSKEGWAELKIQNSV